MTNEEAISHLERVVARLESHIAKQDVEMYQMTKQLEALRKGLARLEGRIGAAGDGASPGPDRDPRDEIPPHY